MSNINFSPEIHVRIQSFDELNTRELYEILQVRSAVFVVEQECPYQDLDDNDFKATHITLRHDNMLVAYARVYKEEESEMWHIGRVLTTRRGQYYGIRVMEESIRVARMLGAAQIEIEAQSYATGFYERMGFRVSSEEFLLDGILHKKMLLQIPDKVVKTDKNR